MQGELGALGDPHYVTSELVDVDVARAAGSAPFGGGAHSFGVGDRDRDAACQGEIKN